jgi:uncharacterized membrane protein YedE/YeeE
VETSFGAQLTEILLGVGLVVVVMAIVILIVGRDPKPRKPRYKGMSGALGVFTELYQPTAREAAQIVEEQSKAREQAGNEDKKKPQSN